MTSVEDLEGWQKTEGEYEQGTIRYVYKNVIMKLIVLYAN